jgi:hypothetical protein
MFLRGQVSLLESDDGSENLAYVMIYYRFFIIII